ncbi:amino acid permease [Pseudomonas viridiflava]|uniref:amino acid permease n=3 Tax=Pseudomonas viridiflava TaxID=33069 RepID=UPI00197C62D6|nr:amino acid permease [Pseudomonas viridiflava]
MNASRLSKKERALSETENHNSALSNGLKDRHVTMLSIGGVIGAGLFIGSGHAIASAGPAVLIAYFLAGALVVLVMRMLGEMAVASPDTGAFSTYATRAIGPWAGFTIGWLYWWFWVIVIPFEAVAVAAILNNWFPGISVPILAFLFIAALTVCNLYSVGKYGEFEFWFALLKVVAIIAFIATCSVALFGGLPGREVKGFVATLHENGGFAPRGYGVVLGALLVTMTSFMGTEIVTIAAAESKNPAEQITRSTNSVIWRIALFYLLSIVLVISIVPWHDTSLPVVGSYQRALEYLQIPYAKLIMDVVILVAVASNLNSAIYTASRMMFSPAKRGDAPSSLKVTTKSGVPARAVLASVVVGMVATFANYNSPGQVFTFLMATSGAIALLVYLVIAVSQLRMRRILIASGKPLALKMWFFPWLTWFVIVFIIGALGYMVTMPEHFYEVMTTAILGCVVTITGIVSKRKSPADESFTAAVGRPGR